MDYSLNQQSTEPQRAALNPDNGKKKGMFEILLIGIVIVFVIGILNYFNIFPLSKLFPNYLGFLTHKNQQVSPITNSQSTPNSTANYSANVFQYDSEKAKTILTKYIKDTIKPEFLPENLDIKQGLSINNTIDEKRKNLFGSYIINKNETISITSNFIENSNTPNFFMIFIHPSKTKQSALNLALANSLVSAYFKNPITIAKCNTNGTASTCKEIKIESEGKREFGALIAQDTSKSPSIPVSTIFSCFIPKESNVYDSIKSCISP